MKLQNALYLATLSLALSGLSACANFGYHTQQARTDSVYGTTGFGMTKQDASMHAVENARFTCGKMPVEVVSDRFRPAQFQQANRKYETNLRYRCVDERPMEISNEPYVPLIPSKPM